MDSQVLHLPVSPWPSGSCGLCTQRLVDLVGDLRGVEEVAFSEPEDVLHLRYLPDLISLETIQRTVRDFGLDIENRYAHDTLTLTNLDCSDCATKIERAVQQLSGVNWAQVNFAAGKIVFEYVIGQVERPQVIERIRRVGYLVEEAWPAGRQKVRWFSRYRLALQTGLAGLLFVLGYALELAASRFESWGRILTSAPELAPEKFAPVASALFLISLFLSGGPVAKSGYYALRTRTLDISVLVTVASLGAVYLGLWGEAAMVMFLFSLGETLERLTMNRTRQAIQALIEISPKDALVRRDGLEERVPVAELKVGDLIVIKPGERIAMDGEIERGISDIDQAPITGESNPVCREPGQKVFAGTIVLSGALEVKVTRLAQDTTLARILRLVKEAQAKKAPSQRMSEKFGKYYTPIVVAGAVLIAALGPLVTGKPFADTLYLALTLLVISCPCALVISTPVAIVSAIGNAARSGVLIKGGAFLEAAGSLKALAFDKTGTLTWGRPEVKDLIPLAPDLDEKKLLAIAASLEQRSEHPLAEAIMNKSRAMKVPLSDVDQFLAVPGRGVRGKIAGEFYYAGNLAFWQESKQDVAPEITARIQALEAEAKTVFLVGRPGQVLGLIAVADRLREQVPAVIADLRRRGVEKLILLTGDNPEAAESIARAAGMDEFRGGLLPQEKVRVMHDLIVQYRTVGMVGDGINDAPALAASSVGIALGTAGTDVALETADIALMSDDLSRLGDTITLSRRAVRIIRQNLAISFFAIGLLLVLTFLGTLNLTLAIIGHEGSALLVIANGMRLFSWRRRAPLVHPGHEEHRYSEVQAQGPAGPAC